MTRATAHEAPARPARSGRASLSAYQRGIALLARREHSRGELRQKLLQRGHEPQEVDSALERLVEQGLQSETRYAESMARMRVGAGHGPLRIRSDLRQKGVDDAGIEAAISEVATDWQMQALDALHRRFGEPALEPEASADHLDRAKRRNRQLAFLLRRGFESDTARAAVQSWQRGT